MEVRGDREKLGLGLTAQRIWQDLVSEHGFPAQYHSVRRYVQKLGRASALPFRRMECEPGAEAQVDFGQGAPVIGPDGNAWRVKTDWTGQPSMEKAVTPPKYKKF